MAATRTTVTRLAGADVCDICRRQETIMFRVDFTDGTTSRRCTRHVAATWDHRPRPAALTA